MYYISVGPAFVRSLQANSLYNLKIPVVSQNSFNSHFHNGALCGILGWVVSLAALH